MLEGTEDVASVATAAGLDALALAKVVSSLQTRRAVAAVRAIAEVQAQLALSRLRVHAVHRLARLAFDDDIAPETGRKAAHALLTVDLDRVGGDLPPHDPGGDGDDDDFTRELRSLRAALYGEVDAEPPSRLAVGQGLPCPTTPCSTVPRHPSSTPPSMPSGMGAGLVKLARGSM